MEATLPKVVEFDHRHAVKVINDGTTTRIIATPNPKWQTKYKSMHDLPFTGRPANWEYWCWWFFPKASSAVESEQRGEFFWNEFAAFARGTKRGRAHDAACLLEYALRDMPSYTDGAREAHAFRKRLVEAIIAHLRVGLDEAKPVDEGVA